MPKSALAKLFTTLLCLSVFVLVGCGGLESVEMVPDSVAQDCTSESDKSGKLYCTGLETMGGACSGFGDLGVSGNSLQYLTPPYRAVPASGWADRYDPGSGIAPCWEWVSTYSRAYVYFDLNTLVGPVVSIEAAALKWTTTRIEGQSYEPSKACIKALYEATGPWDRGKTPRVLLYSNLDTTAVNAGFYGVVETVKRWFANPSQNFGFIIEPARADTMGDSNARCLDALQELRLIVKYRSGAVWPSP